MVKNQKNRSDDIVDDDVFAQLGLGPGGDERADEIYQRQYGGSEQDDIVDDDVFAQLGLGPGGDERADELFQGQRGGRLFEVIRNPETGRNVSIYGNIGQNILRNYVNQLGGHIRSGSLIPAPEPHDMKGGHIRSGSLIPAPEPHDMKGGATSSRKTGPKSFHKKKDKEDKQKVKKMIKKGKTVHPSKLKKTGVKVNTKGGFIRSGSIIPSPEPFNMDNQVAGGNCSLCGSKGTTKRNCPLNPKAKKPNAKKHPKAKKASLKKSSSKKASPKKSSSENKQQSVVKPKIKIYGREWGAPPTDEELGLDSQDDEEEIDQVIFSGYDDGEDPWEDERKQELIEEYGSLEAANNAFEDYEEERIDQANYPYPTPNIPLPSSFPKPKTSKETKSSKGCDMYKIRKKDGSRRLSARCYYDTHGASSVGDKCDGAWGGKPGCLRLTKKGSPKFFKCKSSDSQTSCKE
jgi:hypothetical protein